MLFPIPQKLANLPRRKGAMLKNFTFVRLFTRVICSVELFFSIFCLKYPGNGKKIQCLKDEGRVRISIKNKRQLFIKRELLVQKLFEKLKICMCTLSLLGKVTDFLLNKLCVLIVNKLCVLIFNSLDQSLKSSFQLGYHSNVSM